jgi:hypothetical protein
MGPHSVASYDKQGDAEDQLIPTRILINEISLKYKTYNNIDHDASRKYDRSGCVSRLSKNVIFFFDINTRLRARN